MQIGLVWVGIFLMSWVGAASADVLTVDDILLDGPSLKGKTITVRGFTACAGPNGTMCMLYEDPTNFTKNIFYDASHMGRDDRSTLVSCSLLTACNVTLVGIVVNEPLKVLDVTGMDWGKGMSMRPQQQSIAPAKSGPMTVKDFLLDRAQFRGNTITVKGAAQCNGSSCWLTESALLSQQVAPFSGTELSRDDRKKLLDCSRVFSDGCNAEVTGVVVGDNELKAHSIAWR